MVSLATTAPDSTTRGSTGRFGPLVENLAHRHRLARVDDFE
jgi:hypothetical protein